MFDNNGRPRDFSYLDKLSTDELKELLHQDSMLDESEDSDMDAVLYIMEVLARREDKEAAAQSIDSAWQSFKDNYYPCTSDPEPLFQFDDSGKDEVPVPAKRKPNFLRRFVKPLSVAAIVVFVLLTGTITSYALGFDLWGAFASWTHETFGFTSRPDTAASLPFPNLRTALDMFGSDAGNIVPSWLPEDFGEDIVQVSEAPSGSYIVSRCIGNNREISMEVKVYTSPDFVHRTYEKQNGSVEVYVSNSTEYYITSNGGATRIIWIVENLECSILCDFNIDEIYKMLDSIYER